MKKYLIALVIILSFVVLKNSDYFFIIKHRLFDSKDQSGSITIDFKSLSSSMSENDLKSSYPTVKWDCGAENPELGDRYCLCNVREINEIDSIRVSFFFKNQKLSAVVVYTHQEGYDNFSKIFSKEFGDPKDLGQIAFSLSGRYIWYLKDGLIATETKPTKGGIYGFTWISRELAKERFNVDIP